MKKFLIIFIIVLSLLSNVVADDTSPISSIKFMLEQYNSQIEFQNTLWGGRGTWEMWWRAEEQKNYLLIGIIKNLLLILEEKGDE
jgi:hypothetical protein